MFVLLCVSLCVFFPQSTCLAESGFGIVFVNVVLCIGILFVGRALQYPHVAIIFRPNTSYLAWCTQC
jgi:hypothetical protein